MLCPHFQLATRPTPRAEILTWATPVSCKTTLIFQIDGSGKSLPSRCHLDFTESRKESDLHKVEVLGGAVCHTQYVYFAHCSSIMQMQRKETAGNRISWETGRKAELSAFVSASWYWMKAVPVWWPSQNELVVPALLLCSHRSKSCLETSTLKWQFQQNRQNQTKS